MEVNLAVVADAANMSDSGKLNVLGVFQTLHASAMPCQHPIMSLVVNFEASPMERGTTAKVSINLIDEDGKNVLTLPEHPIKVPADPNVLTPASYLIINLQGVVFDHFGTYRFDVRVNGESVGRIPLHVVRAHPN